MEPFITLTQAFGDGMCVIRKSQIAAMVRVKASKPDDYCPGYPERTRINIISGGTIMVLETPEQIRDM